MNAFDRFACWASGVVSRAPFFAFCCMLVIGWAAQGIVDMTVRGPGAFLDQTYQLEINTTTTVITFLMLALLNNAQARQEKATNVKLNAIADFQADMARKLFPDDEDMEQHIVELHHAVGIEEKVSA